MFHRKSLLFVVLFLLGGCDPRLKYEVCSMFNDKKEQFGPHGKCWKEMVQGLNKQRDTEKSSLEEKLKKRISSKTSDKGFLFGDYAPVNYSLKELKGYIFKNKNYFKPSNPIKNLHCPDLFTLGFTKERDNELDKFIESNGDMMKVFYSKVKEESKSGAKELKGLSQWELRKIAKNLLSKYRKKNLRQMFEGSKNEYKGSLTFDEIYPDWESRLYKGEITQKGILNTKVPIIGFEDIQYFKSKGYGTNFELYYKGDNYVYGRYELVGDFDIKLMKSTILKKLEEGFEVFVNSRGKIYSVYIMTKPFRKFLDHYIRLCSRMAVTYSFFELSYELNTKSQNLKNKEKLRKDKINRKTEDLFK